MYYWIKHHKYIGPQWLHVHLSRNALDFIISLCLMPDDFTHQEESCALVVKHGFTLIWRCILYFKEKFGQELQ